MFPEDDGQSLKSFKQNPDSIGLAVWKNLASCIVEKDVTGYDTYTKTGQFYCTSGET